MEASVHGCCCTRSRQKVAQGCRRSVMVSQVRFRMYFGPSVLIVSRRVSRLMQDVQTVAGRLLTPARKRWRLGTRNLTRALLLSAQLPKFSVVWRRPGETEDEAIERYKREHPEIATRAAITMRVVSWENPTGV